MRPPALFLDRDGVINYDFGYVSSIDDLRWIPGALRTIRAFSEAGWYIFVVSNQAAIGRALCTQSDVERLNAAIGQSIARAGGQITEFYVCPFHPHATCSEYRVADHADRKPNPGMILAAMTAWRPNVQRSFLVGDRLTDLAAARAAGITGHLFRELNLFEFCNRRGLLPG